MWWLQSFQLTVCCWFPVRDPDGSPAGPVLSCWGTHSLHFWLFLVYPPLVRMGFSCPVWKCDQWPLLKRHTLLMLPAAVVQFSGRRSSLSWYYVCTTTVMWPRGLTTNWLWYETPTSFLIENTISLLDLDTSAMLVFISNCLGASVSSVQKSFCFPYCCVMRNLHRGLNGFLE